MSRPLSPKSKRTRLRPAIALTFSAFRRHNASRFGAALAFYIVFSLAPTLLIVIAIAGSFFGRQQAEREILARIGGSFGEATGSAIAAMIKEAGSRHVGWIATGLGMLSLYFGVAGIVRQIHDALQTIWHDAADDAPPTLRRRIASLLLAFAAGAVVVSSIVADALIAATGKYASSRLIGGEFLWHLVQLTASTLVLTALFAAVFRYLPRSRVSWRDVRLGSAVTAFLFVAGKLGLGLYLGKAAVGSAFGAAGSIVVVLLWSYWSAQIFFLGLEFTHVYAQEREAA